MKILVDYDPDTGNISGDGGVTTYFGVGLQHLEHKKEDQIIELANKGFRTDDFLKLKKAGVI